MHRFVVHNNEIRGAAELSLSPGQVGFLNGWGVFSTLRVSRGVLFAYERHYARMQRDARLLRVPFPFSSDQLQQALLSLVEANHADEAVLRVAVIRNKGGAFEAPGWPRESDLLAFTADLKDWGSGARLMTVPNARFGLLPFAGTKTASWSHNLVWLEQAQNGGFDECLLLNERGQVSECTSANIFVIHGRKVVTPPLKTSGCLPGVTRAILLEGIKVADVEISEQELLPSDLVRGDCVFVTSTTRDLLPVSSIDGRPLQFGTEVFKQLSDAFLKQRQSYLESHLAHRELVSS